MIHTDQKGWLFQISTGLVIPKGYCYLILKLISGILERITGILANILYICNYTYASYEIRIVKMLKLKSIFYDLCSSFLNLLLPPRYERYALFFSVHNIYQFIMKSFMPPSIQIMRITD